MCVCMCVCVCVCTVVTLIAQTKNLFLLHRILKLMIFPGNGAVPINSTFVGIQNYNFYCSWNCTMFLMSFIIADAHLLMKSTQTRAVVCCIICQL